MTCAQIIVKGRKRTQVYSWLTWSLKANGMRFGRRNRTAFACQVLKDPHSRQKVLGSAGKDLQHEPSSAYTFKCNSVLHNTSPEALQNFSLESILDELQDATLAKELCYFEMTTIKVKEKNIQEL